MAKTWKVRRQRDLCVRDRFKCYHCGRDASQWILLDEAEGPGDLDIFDVRCHQHRLQAKDLPDGA